MFHKCIPTQYTTNILPQMQELRNSKNTKKKKLKSNSLQIGAITKYPYNKDVTPSCENVCIISVMSLISGTPETMLSLSENRRINSV
jgi:hypothetical protein